MGGRRVTASLALVLFAAGVVIAVIDPVDLPCGPVVIVLLAVGAVAAWHAVKRRGYPRYVLLAGFAVLIVAAVVVVITGERSASASSQSLCSSRAWGLRGASSRRASRSRLPNLRSARSSSGTRSRVAGRPSATTWPTRPDERDRAHRAEARRRPRDSWSATPSPLAPTGWPRRRGRHPGARRLDRSRARPSLCMHPGGDTQPLRARPGGRPRRRRRRPRRLRHGGEHRVDLAEINGRVFVNNASLGIYAEAVQREGYRDAKLRTMLDTMPDVLGSQQTGATSDLGWRGPDGTQHSSAAVILISNNVYRLGNVVGSGSRPRMDGGELGIAVWAPSEDGSRRWLQWSAPTTEITSTQPVPVGVDGEALAQNPSRVRIRPGRCGFELHRSTLAPRRRPPCRAPSQTSSGSLRGGGRTSDP